MADEQHLAGLSPLKKASAVVTALERSNRQFALNIDRLLTECRNSKQQEKEKAATRRPALTSRPRTASARLQGGASSMPWGLPRRCATPRASSSTPAAEFEVRKLEVRYGLRMPKGKQEHEPRRRASGIGGGGGGGGSGGAGGMHITDPNATSRRPATPTAAKCAEARVIRWTEDDMARQRELFPPVPPVEPRKPRLIESVDYGVAQRLHVPIAFRSSEDATAKQEDVGGGRGDEHDGDENARHVFALLQKGRAREAGYLLTPAAPPPTKQEVEEANEIFNLVSRCGFDRLIERPHTVASRRAEWLARRGE